MLDESNLAIRLRIMHDYFVDGVPRDISIRPTEDTQKLLAINGIVFRKEKNGFDLINTSRHDTKHFYAQVLNVGNVKYLEFEFSSADNNFINYTKMPIEELGHFIFSNLSTESTESEEKLALKKVFEANGNHQKIGTIKFDVEELITQYDENILKFEIQFEARKTQWNYLIIGTKDFQSLKIKDQLDINFEGPIEDSLSTGGSALRFTTGDKLIALHESPSSEFLLVDTSMESNEKLAVLPSARPDNIDLKKKEGITIAASTMYVYL